MTVSAGAETMGVLHRRHRLNGFMASTNANDSRTSIRELFADSVDEYQVHLWMRYAERLERVFHG